MYIPFALSIARVKARKLTFRFSRRLSGNSVMRVLNVAEKNDAARNIAAFLSGGTTAQREGQSRTKIYDFECKAFGQNVRMVMTSMKGHIFEIDFTSQYRNWNTCNPILLFEAPVVPLTRSGCHGIKETLEQEIKSCSKLIIWTDCDREGENIGFEAINICKAVKRNIEIHRAVFSEITPQAVKRALANLNTPNKHVSDAVEVRRELDLRIGAAFTRFQTLYLRKAFPDVLSSNIVSYGSCQFPTLGFVVERFKAISEFKPEKFWQINVNHVINDLTVSFQWERNKLFNKLACEVLYDKCAECGNAVVENVESKPRVKWRPKPLDTSELQKMSSKKLKINAKEALLVAENLYTRGLISYPRTETDSFSNDIDLVSLVQCQTDDPHWGEFAQRVIRDGPNPFQGRKSDQAHPPIHPIKYTNALTGNDKIIYEFIVRRFLACLSKHAQGLETVVNVDVAGEKFSAKGLVVTAKNFLEVYPYEKWCDKEIHPYRKGEVFSPVIVMEEGETSPPELLTEADIISLMEKHGIGTDATQAEHIETIKARLYVGLQDDKYFVPRTLGMGLIEGYNSMGYAIARPEMRAELEEDLKRICQNQKSSAEVLQTHLEKYKSLYEGVQKQMINLAKSIQNFIQVEPSDVEAGFLNGTANNAVGKCPHCYSDMHLRRKKDGGWFIACSGYPKCRTSLWLPSFVLQVSKTEEACSVCGPNYYLLQFKFKRGSCYYPPNHIGCIGGCDWNLLEVLNCNTFQRKEEPKRKRNQKETRAPREAVPSVLHEINDSGFVSPNEESSSVRLPPGNPPKCYCGKPAVCLTVKKSGPNEGREFYSCNMPRGSPKCSFFQWKGEPSPSKSETNVRPTPALDEDMRCYCSIPCRRHIVTKEGQNKGRAFLSCGKPFREQDKCDFFKWADTDENKEVYGRRSHDRRYCLGGCAVLSLKDSSANCKECKTASYSLLEEIGPKWKKWMEMEKEEVLVKVQKRDTEEPKEDGNS